MEIHGEIPGFSVLDYIVFVGSLVLSLAIGLYYAFCKKQDTNEDFLMAGRNMGPFPVALSLLASFVSAITILAFPAEAYYNGLEYSLGIISYCIAVLIVGITLMPLLYHLKVTSIYEYLELRFQSRLIRKVSTITFMLKSLMYMAVVLYTPALALSVVTPLTTWASVLTVGAICSLYTGFGGLKAVLWTDVFQVLMMVAGLLAIVIQGSIEMGGVQNIWNIAAEKGRTSFFNFTFDPFLRLNFWTIIVGKTIGGIALFGCSQTSVQRYLSMRSYKEAQWALFANIPMKIIVSYMAFFTGLVAFAVYVECDPKAAGIIQRSDEIMPYYVMNMLGHITGLPGLFVACVFSASLSSLSSGLNAMAACTWEDFVMDTGCGKWLTKHGVSLYFNKFMALLYGVFSVGFAFLVGELGTIIDALLTVTGAINGPLFAAFVAAIFIPWCNKKGLTAGMFVGYVFCIWLAIGSQVTGKKAINVGTLPLSTEGCPEYLNVTRTITTPTFPESPLHKERFELSDMYRITFVLYTTVGLIVTLLVAVPLSLLTGGYPLENIHPSHIHPCLRNYLSRKKKEIEEKKSRQSSNFEFKSYINQCYIVNPE